MDEEDWLTLQMMGIKNFKRNFFQDAPAMTQLLKLSSVMKKSAEAYHDGM